METLLLIGGLTLVWVALFELNRKTFGTCFAVLITPSFETVANGLEAIGKAAGELFAAVLDNT